MEDSTVVITIKDGDTLCVSVIRLTADSSEFRRLIYDLGLTELEIEDFAPEVVTLFMTLLEDKIVSEIEDSQFRELHKLSIVFKVQWLTEQCQEWLIAKIGKIDGPLDYDYQLFLLEECRYILNKWKWRKFTDILIAKIAFKDNTTFITHYMTNFDDLKADQVDIMLKLAGSNTMVLLEIMTDQIRGKTALEGNVKYLLENINLALCFQQNEELSNQLLKEVLAIPELPNDDLRLLTKLTAESVSGVKDYFRKTRIDTELNDIRPLIRYCQTLNSIIRLVADQRVGNMFLVVEMVTLVTVEISQCTPSLKTPGVQDSKIEAEAFVNELETRSRDKPLKRVSTEYMDMLISAMKLLDSEEIVRCIIILEIIRDNINLCSHLDNFLLVSSQKPKLQTPSSDDVLRYFSGEAEKYYTTEKILYNFKHPGTSDCSKPEKCGFIIKYRYGRIRLCKEETDYNSTDLCKEEADYNDTDLHYHDVVCAENMYYYQILSATLDGTKVRVPVRRRWLGRRWWEGIGENIDWKFDQCCIAYNVKDYLVAKYY